MSIKIYWEKGQKQWIREKIFENLGENVNSTKFVEFEKLWKS